MSRRALIQIFIGVGILLLLFYEVDLHAVMDAIRGLNFILFGFAALSYLCYNLLMSYRLYYLLGRMGIHVSYLHSLFAHLGGMIASDVTPGRAGFFLVPYFLRNRTNCTLSDGMAAILAPQGIEFILKVLGGFLGLIFFITVISADIGGDVLLPLCVGGIIFLGAGTAILWLFWSGESRSCQILRRIPYINRFEEGYRDLKEKSLSLRGSVHVILAIYFLCWVLLALQWQLIGSALGISRLNFLTYFLLHPLVTILRFVPITISGLGLMEGATAAMFFMLGVPRGISIGLAFSLLVRLNMIIVDSTGLRGVFSVKRSSNNHG